MGDLFLNKDKEIQIVDTATATVIAKITHAQLLTAIGKTDMPGSFLGQANKLLVVNSAEDAFIFEDIGARANIIYRFDGIHDGLAVNVSSNRSFENGSGFSYFGMPSLTNTWQSFFPSIRFIKSPGINGLKIHYQMYRNCLLYTSPSPRDLSTSRMPSSA